MEGPDHLPRTWADPWTPQLELCLTRPALTPSLSFFWRFNARHFTTCIFQSFLKRLKDNPALSQVGKKCACALFFLPLCRLHSKPCAWERPRSRAQLSILPVTCRANDFRASFRCVGKHLEHIRNGSSGRSDQGASRDCLFVMPNFQPQRDAAS